MIAATSADRLDSMTRLLGELDGGRLAGGARVPELDVASGYAAWAPSYDSMSNALIRAEEPLVRRAVADLPIGTALDVACGTGRHAAWLSARRAPHHGSRRDTRDARPSPAPRARRGVQARRLHELARVVRPGGRVVLTDAHPTFVIIQGQAMVPSDAGLAFVRNYPHLHSTYLEAFRSAGLSVRDCLEAPMETDFTEGMFAEVADAAAALWKGIPVALVWSLEEPASGG